MFILKTGHQPGVYVPLRALFLVPFRERPVLYQDPLFFQQPLSQQLEEEVANLLRKGAVEEIIPECPGFYSRIFLVPKKNGKLRLIIDLSALNHFVDCQSFKMETQRKVRNAVRLNDWAFSLDLTDAYLHVPIHRRSRKYLRFTLKGRVYEFKALPFGLSTSPLVFTRLMSVIATFVRKRAITLHPYLGDWLARNQSRRALLEHRQFLLSLINSLGLIINYEKSDLVPAQVFTFIGMEFLTQTNIVRVPQDRVLKILETVRQFSQKYSVSARDFLSLLGQLGAAADFVMLGRLHLRPLQMSQPVETAQITVEPPDWWYNGNSPSSQMVAAGRSFSSGCSSEDRSSLPLHVHGRQSHRLGGACGTGGTSVSWSMDRRPIPAPHQCVRDEGNISISSTSPSNREKHHCIGVDRQHYSGGLFEASGRDPFPRPLSRSLGHSTHVPETQHSVVSKAHSWAFQHSGRPDVQNGQANQHRVVSRSGNCQQNFSDHGLSVHRPVRHTAELQTAPVCVTHTGSAGAINRCSHNGLESHPRLCVSSVPSNSSCDKQSTVIPVQNRIVSASMARQTVVPRTTASVGVTTGISTSNSQTAYSVKRKDHTSKSGSSATSRLGIVQQSLRDRQFSREVADHVSKARRESTLKVYDAKWQVFCRWAHQRKINPIQATPQIVADFFTFLFNVKKNQVSTIKGYRSTISNTLKFKNTGYDFGSHPVLSELIKSFQRQRPVDRPLARNGI